MLTGSKDSLSSQKDVYEYSVVEFRAHKSKGYLRITHATMPSSVPFAIGLLRVLFILGSILPPEIFHFPVCCMKHSAELKRLFEAERRGADGLILLILLLEEHNVVDLRLVLVVLTDSRASCEDFTWEYDLDEPSSAFFTS